MNSKKSLESMDETEDYFFKKTLSKTLLIFIIVFSILVPN